MDQNGSLRNKFDDKFYHPPFSWHQNIRNHVVWKLIRHFEFVSTQLFDYTKHKLLLAVQHTSLFPEATSHAEFREHQCVLDLPLTTPWQWIGYCKTRLSFLFALPKPNMLSKYNAIKIGPLIFDISLWYGQRDFWHRLVYCFTNERADPNQRWDFRLLYMHPCSFLG